MATEDILKKIKKLINTNNKSNILIGIDGGQGSGKTHFINNLERKINNYNNYWVEKIEIDDFLLEREKREKLSIKFFENISNLSLFFDFKKFAQTVKLLAKSKNRDIKIDGLYNRKTGKRDRSEIKHLKDKNIIIVGGPYLLSPILPQFDLKIFLDASEKKRLKNTLRRTDLNQSRYQESQKELFKKFELFFKPYYTGKFSAYNLVIDNNNFKNIKILKK